MWRVGKDDYEYIPVCRFHRVKYFYVNRKLQEKGYKPKFVFAPLPPESGEEG